MKEKEIIKSIVETLKENSGEATETWITGNVVFEDDFIKVAESIFKKLNYNQYCKSIIEQLLNKDKLHREVKKWLYHKASDEKALTVGDDKIEILINSIRKNVINFDNQ